MGRILGILADSFWPLMKAGLLTTVPLTLISFVLGMVVAFIVAMMRLSKIKVLSLIEAVKNSVSMGKNLF